MKKLLCFGDSNTYGFRYYDRGRFDESIRWTGLLTEWLKPYGIEVIESGLNSRTTVFDYAEKHGKNGNKALPLILEENSPVDIVIVMLGTNDCKTEFHADSDMIANGIETIVNQIKLADENTKIILVCPPFIDKCVTERGFSQSFDENSVYKSIEIKDKFKQCALKNNCVFVNASDFADTKSTDGIHLNEKGHYALAKALFECIEKNFL